MSPEGNVLTRIVDRRDNLRRSERKVADVVLADPHSVIKMTMAGLAKASQVSEPTIVRFANAIGCDGFHDFRIQLAQGAALGIPATQSVIESDDNVAAIGSGGPYATAAARALMENTDFSAREIAEKAMEIAGEICIYTNDHITIEELKS